MSVLWSSARLSYWRMALVLKERWEAEAAGRRRDLERREEERKRFAMREDAIELRLQKVGWFLDLMSKLGKNLCAGKWGVRVGDLRGMVGT